MSERFIDDPETPPHIVCRTCMTTLDVVDHLDDNPVDRRLTVPGRREYKHAAAVSLRIGNTDHPVDPVLYDPTTMELVGVCDFCSTPGPRWRYPATSFIDTKSGYGSVDDWGACDACHDLIERGDPRSQRALVDRSLARFTTVWERRAMRPDLTAFHDQFRLHRTGPPEATW